MTVRSSEDYEEAGMKVGPFDGVGIAVRFLYANRMTVGLVD